MGLAARASGIGRDLRVDMPWPPYDRLRPTRSTQTTGDVAARVQVRFDELLESISALPGLLLASFPQGAIRSTFRLAEPDRLGSGLIEGWRGPVLVALQCRSRRARSGAATRTIPRGRTGRCSSTPSSDNIVPDFPLINKSFNLSYSGHDG